MRCVPVARRVERRIGSSTGVKAQAQPTSGLANRVLNGYKAVMNVTSPSFISQVANQVQGPDAVQIAVLRKAINLQQQQALALLQAVPQAQPQVNGSLPLATQGSVGTRLNVMA